MFLVNLPNFGHNFVIERIEKFGRKRQSPQLSRSIIISGLHKSSTSSSIAERIISTLCNHDASQVLPLRRSHQIIYKSTYIMGKRSDRTASKKILQTLVTERYVQRVNKAAQAQFSDSNGVPLIGQDHHRQESAFQVTLSKAKIENLMKAKDSKAGMISLDNGRKVMIYDAEKFDEEVCDADMAYFAGKKNDKHMSSECNCSTKLTFAEVYKIDPESIGARSAKDYLRAVTADIDPNFQEKGMVESGMWNGWFGDQNQEGCDGKQHDVYGKILGFGACGEWFGGDDQEEEFNEEETLDERDDVLGVVHCNTNEVVEIRGA